MTVNIEKLTIKSSASIAEAMTLIDKMGSGVCFVVDKALVGIVTDGDIRRALLSGCGLDSSIDVAMTKNFFSLSVGANISDIQKNLQNYKYIPIVSDDGELVDLATQKNFHQIPLIEPVFDGNELEYVTDCITSGWVSSQGRYVTEFEEVFADYVGSPYALAVSNGTVALHLALLALGVGAGDEVIVPDLTFAAPVNAICYVGATPVLVDVDQNTMSVNPKLVEAAITSKTKAIIVVHLYGHPADMLAIKAIAKQNNLKIIEDCAEALGSFYQGKHVGQFGDAATFSFFGNKTITTGEGGMLILNDSAVLSRAKMLRDHGMSKQRRYWHEEVGFNYRLTNIQAALGLAQMERVTEFVDRKRWIAEQYKLHLSNVAAINLPGDYGDVLNSYWLYTIVLGQGFEGKRDGLLETLKLSGIESRPVFYPIHKMPPYSKYCSDLSCFGVSENISAAGLSLPTSVKISADEIEKICLNIKKFMNFAL